MKLLKSWILTNATLTFAIQSNKFPHILLIVADDQGKGDVGYEDNSFFSPTIDKLAMDGLNLDRMYSATTCSPTRGALLTGKYINNIGLQDGAYIPGENRTLSLAFKLLPEYLKEVGYKTMGIGKWHLGMNKENELPHRRGFDEWFGNLQGEQDNYNNQVGMECNSANQENPDHFPSSWGSNCYSLNGFDLSDNGIPAIEYIEEQDFYPDLLTKKAVEKISAHDGVTPLFMYVAPTTPHAPLQAPQKYMEKCSNVTEGVEELQEYNENFRVLVCAMVYAMDSMVLSILDSLSYKNMLDDTIIFYISDNGGVKLFGSKNLDLNGQKGGFFEGGVRVPSFISGKRIISSPSLASATSHDMMFVTDLFATIATVAGLDKSIIDISDGQSILALDENKNFIMNPNYHRDMIPLGASGYTMGNTSGVIFVYDNITWKYTEFPNALSFYGGYESPIQGIYLFDLTTDIYETQNLFDISSYYEIVGNIGKGYVKEMIALGLPSPMDEQGCGWINNSPSDTGCWIPSDSIYAAKVDCKLLVVPYYDDCVPSMNEALIQAGFNV